MSMACMTNGFVVKLPSESVAVSEKENDPDTVGVPSSTADSASKLTPVGNAPAVNANASAPVPPLASMTAEKKLPLQTPPRSLAVEKQICEAAACLRQTP